VFELQDQYYRLAGGSARSQFADLHPELRDYWAWRRDWLLRNPDVVPYLVENEEDYPKYASVAQMEAAYANQPNLTWREWSLTLPPDVVVLVADRIRRRQPFTGPLLDELRAIADGMGTDLEQMVGNIRDAYAAYHNQ
jgi:hypothetical protein